MDAIVVITSVGTEEQANVIARELVARRHAACVNIIPGVRSLYRWKGGIQKDGELLLVAKTLGSEFEAVKETIQELHDYELPEVLAFEVGRADSAFLDWMLSSVDKDADFDDDDEFETYEDGDEE